MGYQANGRESTDRSANLEMVLYRLRNLSLYSNQQVITGSMLSILKQCSIPWKVLRKVKSFWIDFKFLQLNLIIQFPQKRRHRQITTANAPPYKPGMR